MGGLGVSSYLLLFISNWMSKTADVLPLQCAIPPVPWHPGKISHLSLLAPGMESHSFLMALTFQVWTSAQALWCLCRAISYSEMTTQTCTSGDGPTCRWSFSIINCWTLCHRGPDFWITDKWGWEEAALMEKLGTVGMEFLYCHQENGRDFQITDHFKHKLDVHLSAPSTSRKEGGSCMQDFCKHSQQSAKKPSSCLCVYCQPGILTFPQEKNITFQIP